MSTIGMALFDILKEVGQLPAYLSIGSWAVIVFSIAAWVALRPQAKDQPEALPDYPFPFISNAYRFIVKTDEFITWSSNFFNEKRKILSMWLGPQRLYLITGPNNVQEILRASGHLGNEDLTLRALVQLDGMSQKDIQVWKNDRSGRGHKATNDTPEKDRIWGPNHKIIVDHLSSTAASATLMEKFSELMMDVINKRSKEKWETVNLWQFVTTEVVEAAIISVAGRKLLELNPDFTDAMWAFDDTIFALIMGVPKFLYPSGYAKRDRFHEMGDKWHEYASANYDFNGPDVDWEEMWGTRFMRVQYQFLKGRGFDKRSIVGMSLGTVWATNANSSHIIAWCLFEVVQDPALFAALREQVETVLEIDPSTGQRKFDYKRLASIPLLASIYAEIMRIHVSYNVTRNVVEDMTFDGIKLKKGALVQSPGVLSHLDDQHWSVPGHPADKFWAERFIVYEEEKDNAGRVTRVPKFSTAGHTGYWFPYGGGSSICAGRAFAKLEIMTCVALLVTYFDVELVEYVHHDGRKSDREPLDDKRRSGAIAMPPDRDVKIRWKRI